MQNCRQCLTMSSKCVLFLLVTFYYCQTSETKIIESNFYREESCTAKNGYCLLENECPGQVTNDLKTSCPSQRSKGAVCCPHVKQEDTNCFQLHNVCRENCPTSLTLGRKGCPTNSVCCVLV